MKSLIIHSLLAAVVSAKGKNREPVEASKVGAPVVQGAVRGDGKQTTITSACPDGYYFDDGLCVSKQEVPQAHNCPSGTHERHGQCLQFSPARFQCANGLTLQGDVCVGNETVHKVQQCPSGSSLVGNQCLIHIAGVPHCPSGTAAIDGRCAKLMPIVKACPQGYSSRGDLCATTEYSDAITACPNGTFADGNGMCKAVTTTVDECPEGTYDVGQGRCATYSNRLRECPKGYSSQGSMCTRTETVQKIAVCPNGADPADQCKVIVPVPLSPVCKSGKLLNGQCHKPRRYKPDLSCPSGYTLSGHNCVKVTQYDCSKTHHDIVCEDVPTGKGGAGIPHRRMLGVDAKGKYQSANYSKRHSGAPLPVCHKVPVNQPKTCEKTITAQAEPRCANGGQMRNGNICEIDEYFAPDMKCDAHTDNSGNCFVAETTAVIRSCPDGYSNTGRGCTRSELAEPNFFCPPGTEEPNCATYVNKECLARGGNGDCSYTVIEPQQVYCPEGYHMIEFGGQYKQGKGGNGNQCTRTIYADKVSRCPANAEQPIDDLTCATFVDKVSSSHDKRVPIQKLCPEGYSEERDQCVKPITQRADVVCPDGQLVEDHNCYNAVPMVATCPKGAVFEKERCWAFSKVKPLQVETVVATGKQVSRSKGYHH